MSLNNNCLGINFSITGDVYRTSIGKRELIPDPMAIASMIQD